MNVENVSGYVNVTVVRDGISNGFGECKLASHDKPSVSEVEPGIVDGISVVVTCPNPDDRGDNRRAVAINGGGEPLVDAVKEGLPLRSVRESASLLAQQAFVNANCGNCAFNPSIAKNK